MWTVAVTDGSDGHAELIELDDVDLPTQRFDEYPYEERDKTTCD